MKKILIEKIKDFIICELYYIKYDEIYQNEKIEKNKHSYNIGVASVEPKFTHNDIVEYIFPLISKKINHITKENIKCSIDLLIGDRFLKTGYPNADYVSFANKGLQHHLNERSFEDDYNNNRKTNFAIKLSIIAILISIAPAALELYKLIINLL